MDAAEQKRCQEMVDHGHRHTAQCSRKAVTDGDPGGRKTRCTQHSAAATEGRDQKSREKYAAEFRISQARQIRAKARHQLVDDVERLLHEADSEAFQYVQLNGFWKSTLRALITRARR